MEDQAEFLRWWEETVTPNRGGGEKLNRGPAIKLPDAEAQTGITKQQVSKWRRRLKEPEKYREMLYGAAYFKAMAEKGQTDQRGASTGRLSRTTSERKPAGDGGGKAGEYASAPAHG